MKITLSFDLQNAEEISAARRILNSIDPHGAARDLPRGEIPVGQVSAPPPPPDTSAAAPPPPPPDTSAAAPPPPPPDTLAAAPPPPDELLPVSTPDAGTTAPAPPAAGASQEVDSLGHPWDPRFHVLRKKKGQPNTRPKLKDGTWSRRRGVQKEDVIAALGQPSSAPATTPPQPPPPPPPAPAVEPGNGAAGPVTWEMVIEAFAARSTKYTQEQLQGALLAEHIDPVALHQTPINYAAAIQVLNRSCPV